MNIQDKKILESAATTSLKDTSDVISKINSNLSNEGVLETRETIRLLKNKHPLIDDFVNSLSYFQAISESIGASYLAYTVDKPSLQLANWEDGTPLAIRKNIKSKIRSDIAPQIQQSYDTLNKKFVSNISNEFFTERSAPISNYANDYHILGDSLWYSDHMWSFGLPLTVSSLLYTIFGDQVTLINYLTPIMQDLSIANDAYIITAEGNRVVIDKRTNIIRAPFTIVNDDALTPVPPQETK